MVSLQIKTTCDTKVTQFWENGRLLPQSSYPLEHAKNKSTTLYHTAPSEAVPGAPSHPIDHCYIQLFEGNGGADVAPGENECDTPGLSPL